MHERCPIRPPAGNIEEDSGGQVRPQYEIVQRTVSLLTPGDLIIEPNMGEVRVAGIGDAGWDNLRHVGLRQVYWVDDNGLSTAARVLPEDAEIPVRLPALDDRAYIKRAIDQAVYLGRDIDEHTARLIAAHLQRGVATRLYEFAASGHTDERIYTELDEVLLHPSPALGRWVKALGAYCLARERPR